MYFPRLLRNGKFKDVLQPEYNFTLKLNLFNSIDITVLEYLKLMKCERKFAEDPRYIKFHISIQLYFLPQTT